MTLTPVDGARATWCEEHQKSITAHHIEETQLKTASNLVSTLYSEHTLWGRSRARFDNENMVFAQFGTRDGCCGCRGCRRSGVINCCSDPPFHARRGPG